MSAPSGPAPDPHAAPLPADLSGALDTALRCIALASTLTGLIGYEHGTLTAWEAAVREGVPPDLARRHIRGPDVSRRQYETLVEALRGLQARTGLVAAVVPELIHAAEDPVTRWSADCAHSAALARRLQLLSRVESAGGNPEVLRLLVGAADWPDWVALDAALVREAHATAAARGRAAARRLRCPKPTATAGSRTGRC